MTDLMDLVDAYAEARHAYGAGAYNAKTAEARKAVEDFVSGIGAGGVESLRKHPAAVEPVASNYSLDTDTHGIRALTCAAIMGAITLGAQNTNPAPDGHWLAPFWEMANEHACRHPGSSCRCAGCGHVLEQRRLRASAQQHW